MKKWIVWLIVVILVATTAVLLFVLAAKTNNELLINQSEEFLSVVGTFTDKKIKNGDDAIAAVQDFCNDQGLSNLAEELRLDKENTVNNLTYYRLQQCHQGLDVYGRSFVAVVNQEGKAVGLSSNATELKGVDIKPTIQWDSLNDIACEYAETVMKYDISSITIGAYNSGYPLVIYTLDANNKETLAYVFSIIVNNNPYELFVDAHSGTVIDCLSTIYTEEMECVVIDNNVQKSFKGYYDPEYNIYRMYDDTRNIHILSAEKTDLLSKNSRQTLVVSEDNHIFGDNTREQEMEQYKGAMLLSQVQLAYDFFYERYSDNVKGTLLAYYNDSFDNGNNARGGLGGVSPDNLSAYNDVLDATECGLVSFEINCDLSEIDIIAHEYTHCVENNISNMAYRGDSGAIMEGYSDIFGELVEQWCGEEDESCDWKNGFRNIMDPSQIDCPKEYGGINWKTTDYTAFDNGNVHHNSTVISHTAYLMATGVGGGYTALSTEELADLWYQTLYTLPVNCRFVTLRNNMEMVAVASGLSIDKQACVVAAFNNVGIYGASFENVNNTITINVYDNLRNSFDDYEIRVSGKVFTDPFRLGRTKDDYTETFSDTNQIHLENGDYSVTIIDKNDINNTACKNIRVRKENVERKLMFFLRKNENDQEDSDTINTMYSMILSNVEADSIQYYNCSESGNFAVIKKNGKYGIIGYNGKILLPIEYDEIYQGRGYGYDYLWASKGDYFYSISVNGKAEESNGYPGGDVDPVAYWYNDKVVVFLMSEGVVGEFEDLSSIAVEQRRWAKKTVLPIQNMSGIKQEPWGPMAKIDNKNYALLDTNTGKLVSGFIYSGFDTGNGFSEGVLAVKKGDKWGFVDAKGNEITDFIYDPYEQNDMYEDMEYKYSIFTATNGYIAVLKNGKWGLLDTQGNTVVEASYDGISQVNPDGMFWLKEKGEWSLYQIN